MAGIIFTPDFKTCIIDSPEAIEAIQYWADLLLSGEVMPSPSQIVDEGGAGADGEADAGRKDWYAAGRRLGNEQPDPRRFQIQFVAGAQQGAA